ncbi:hypothetical protein [Chryseobacterium paludis]|uniref:hypothetical protein n=1 Tax=Chryseobacterium paludis TaxID=2956784 RepID=UPI0021BF251A|nr:hypothetical protein [Chryseobacterium paludis]
MKKRNIIILFLTSIVFFAGYLFYRNSYTTFQPTRFDGNNYESYIPENNSEFHRRLKKVLSYYGEDFKTTEDGNILIKQELQSDSETIYNYTNKALDYNWQKSK